MRLPLMPLRTVLFPGIALPLVVFEDRYLRMVRDCVAEREPFGVALIRRGEEVGGLAEPYPVGTTAHVLRAREGRDGAVHLIAMGHQRFRILALEPEGDLLRADVSLLRNGEGRVSTELQAELLDMLNRHLHTLSALVGMPEFSLSLDDDPDRLSYLIAAQLGASPDVQQRLLETASTAERLVVERDLLQREMDDYEALRRAYDRARRTQPQPSPEHGFLSVN
jgi:Lon protease-like protein